jgi:hypothetical protein
MIKIYFTFFIAIITFSYSTAQAPEIEWLKTYGGSNSDTGYSIRTTTDGGYVVTGTTFSDDGDVTVQFGNGDFWVIKLNSIGEIEWEKSIGTIDNDYSFSIEQTSDGGYIIVGLTGDAFGDNTYFFTVKLFSNGDIQWQNTFGGSSIDVATSVKETNDGGFIITGHTQSSDGDVSQNQGSVDIWVIKISSLGQLIWEKSFGGSGFDQSVDIQLTNDGGFIVVGHTTSNDGDVSNNNGFFDFWIFKISNSGLLQWEKSFGGSNEETARSVKQTNDGDYIVVGSTKSDDGDISELKGIEDFWVIKLTENGDLIWEKTYGGTQIDRAWYVQLTSDNNYVVVGETYSDDGDVSINQGLSDVWIIKISENGELLWEKTIGGTAIDEARNIQETNDGGLIISGYTYSNDGDIMINQGENDFLIVKLGPDNLSNSSHINLPTIDIYPNPAQDFLYINVEKYNTNQEIKIVDVLGNTLYSQVLMDSKTKIDMSSFSSGVYLVKFKDKNYTKTIKIIKK